MCQALCWTTGRHHLRQSSHLLKASILNNVLQTMKMWLRSIRWLAWIVTDDFELKTLSTCKLVLYQLRHTWKIKMHQILGDPYVLMNTEYTKLNLADHRFHSFRTYCFLSFKMKVFGLNNHVLFRLSGKKIMVFIQTDHKQSHSHGT